MQVATEKANAQALVLSNQVAQSAETLRTLVATTANTQATQLDQTTKQITDRLLTLEKAQYETRGSSSGGMQALWGWLIAVLAVVAAFYQASGHR